MAATIRALKMKVGLCSCDSLYYTLDPARVKTLRKELDARKAAGCTGGGCRLRRCIARPASERTQRSQREATRRSILFAHAMGFGLRPFTVAR